MIASWLTLRDEVVVGRLAEIGLGFTWIQLRLGRWYLM